MADLLTFKEPVAPNLTYHFFYLYIKYIPTQTHLLFSQLHHANVYATILTFITQISLPLGRKNTKPEVQSLCVLHHTMAEIYTCTKTHCKDYSIRVLIFLCLKSNYVFWC